jgi:hypothetical protein
VDLPISCTLLWIFARLGSGKSARCWHCPTMCCGPSISTTAVRPCYRPAHRP